MSDVPTPDTALLADGNPSPEPPLYFCLIDGVEQVLTREECLSQGGKLLSKVPPPDPGKGGGD